jgi:hypothetical protein
MEAWWSFVHLSFPAPCGFPQSCSPAVTIPQSLCACISIDAAPADLELGGDFVCAEAASFERQYPGWIDDRAPASGGCFVGAIAFGARFGFAVGVCLSNTGARHAAAIACSADIRGMVGSRSITEAKFPFAISTPSERSRRYVWSLEITGMLRI